MPPPWKGPWCLELQHKEHHHPAALLKSVSSISVNISGINSKDSVMIVGWHSRDITDEDSVSSSLTCQGSTIDGTATKIKEICKRSAQWWIKPKCATTTPIWILLAQKWSRKSWRPKKREVAAMKRSMVFRPKYKHHYLQQSVQWRK
jgi:hypothetical protein